MLVWPDYRPPLNGVRLGSLGLESFWYRPLALDYPPFFAYFEKVLSIGAALVDPAMVQLNNLKYDAWSVIAYQRCTVIVSELVLGSALTR